MQKTSKLSNRLYLKISSTLLLILLILAMGYVAITAYTEQRYFQEVNQKLYGSIAPQTVKEVKPFVDGKVDTSAIHDIMHSMMVINPNVEVYLLDTEGKIITYVSPHKKIELEKVELEPIVQFINSDEKPFILGNDPRNPGKQKVFSAAPILEEDELTGYVYIILASEEQEAVTSSLYNSRMLNLGQNLFFITLFGALVIGLLAIWYLTGNLRTIVETVRRFKEGDYKARVPENAKGDLVVLADTFNDMADQINANIDKIKSVEALRRELIANVSHDLRTPLAIMQGYVETMLMKEGKLTAEERTNYLNIVLSSSEKLSRLVAQLFEYSKLEAKQIQPQKEPFFISELAQDVFQKYQILAKEKGVQMHLDIPKDLPLVFADISLVERVMQNLMDNALKFTPKGGSVSIELMEQESSVKVKIADTGPGIPETEQSYIFERYRRAKKEKEKISGTGLGLSIAKKIMEIHNSSIWVQSKPNQGAAFLFLLPAYQEGGLVPAEHREIKRVNRSYSGIPKLRSKSNQYA